MLDIVKGLLVVCCSLIIGSIHIMLSKYLVYAICHEVRKNALGAGKTKKNIQGEMALNQSSLLLLLCFLYK